MWDVLRVWWMPDGECLMVMIDCEWRLMTDDDGPWCITLECWMCIMGAEWCGMYCEYGECRTVNAWWWWLIVSDGYVVYIDGWLMVAYANLLYAMAVGELLWMWMDDDGCWCVHIDDGHCLASYMSDCECWWVIMIDTEYKRVVAHYVLCWVMVDDNLVCLVVCCVAGRVMRCEGLIICAVWWVIYDVWWWIIHDECACMNMYPNVEMTGYGYWWMVMDDVVWWCMMVMTVYE